jgi:activator of 2-hydroxyglutaryl-CoA dehydratase/predicted nucleotide-binding protein (sugar kinase/HSP70/actin superfamily)
MSSQRIPVRDEPAGDTQGAASYSGEQAGLFVGFDVGSTTVKAVVFGGGGDRVVWRDYRRHESRQTETVLEFLRRIEDEVGLTPGRDRIFVTGSGGGRLAPLVGGRFVHEVAAVSIAVERLHPEANSVVELGGQGAKIIVFREDPQGRRTKIPSMNDKCAGGTGVIIDKIAAKLHIPPEALGEQGYANLTLHPVAGKCGVFAETDINGLQKRGVPAEELMASLFEAIVLQNLTVLARGQTLRPHVLLLGGPNYFIRGLREAWQHNIPLLWRDRRVQLPPGARPEDLIRAPEDALYFGALGAVEFGRREEESVGAYLGTRELEHYADTGRRDERARSGQRGLVGSSQELDAFKATFARPPFQPASFEAGQEVRGFIGIDGGSTSTKAVLLSPDGDVLCKAYQLSKGNPIEDAIDMLTSLRAQVEGCGARLQPLGVGTTGYAKDILRDVLQADTALVETVAHTEAALAFYQDPHVIVDVGGQDIKIIVLSDGRVKDFKLNTQCSAGNGYFLQAIANQLGVKVQQYADTAFTAELMPTFGYGCAVFLQSDIVNFQRQGWQVNQILAGLAAVLPKNVFLYVAGVTNLAQLGTRFVLQGATQMNLAVVKAEVDFIHSHFHSAARPDIIVHQHCGEAGAIGTALEAIRLWRRGRATTFIGLDQAQSITYSATRNEETRCGFCKNHCLRTYIDIHTESTDRRLIVANCEQGVAADVESMRAVKSRLDAVKSSSPSLVDIAAHEVWKPTHPPSVASPQRPAWLPQARRRRELADRRAELRVGIPRVLNLFAYAPLFSAYLESLGVRPGNIVYSDYTSDELYRAGAGRGAIDPCFPTKIVVAHVHNLLFTKHRLKPLHCIFLPMFDVLRSPLVNLLGTNACPSASVTPDTVKAAFTRDEDLFAVHGLQYLNPLINVADRKLFAQQMMHAWDPLLGLDEGENARALEAGFAALDEFERDIRQRARQAIDALTREGRIGIVVLGRPYHHDPGLNHGILEQLQALGYPIFSQSTLPLDADLLDALFAEEVQAGAIRHPLEITDVWKNALSASTNHKLWAAKFTARHPNLVALELSNFKCGHDAPIFTVIERIMEHSGTPYFAFKEIDENKPLGSIKLRVETIDYFLTRYREEIASAGAAQPEALRKLLA